MKKRTILIIVAAVGAVALAAGGIFGVRKIKSKKSAAKQVEEHNDSETCLDQPAQAE